MAIMNGWMMRQPDEFTRLLLNRDRLMLDTIYDALARRHYSPDREPAETEHTHGFDEGYETAIEDLNTIIEDFLEAQNLKAQGY